MTTRGGTERAILIVLFPSTGLLLLNGFWNDPLYRYSATAFWMLDVITHVLMPAALLLWLARAHGIGPRDYGLAPPRGGYGELLALTTFVALVFWFSYKPVAALFGNLLMSEASALTYVDIVPTAPLLRLLVVLYFSLSAAVFEEILYRGLPLVYCAKRFAAKRAGSIYVAASSMLFGMAHWENGLHEIAGTTSLGFVACVLYLRLRTLWPLVGAHMAVDVASFA